MKKLDDIPKRDIFEVPDGYFDKLPLIIQARLEKPEAWSLPVWNMALRYALPVIVVGFALVFIFKPKTMHDPEGLLAEIGSDHLVAFLHDSDVSEQDLLEVAALNEADADSLTVHVNENYLLEGLDMKDLKNELENEL